MPRPYPSSSLQPNGQLDYKEIKANTYGVFFTPPVEALPSRNPYPEKYRKLIFEIDNSNHLITIYPYQVWGAKPMTAKYYTLKRIVVDIKWHETPYVPDVDGIQDFLSYELPFVLTEDYNYGIAFRKNYKPIVSMFEGFGIEEIYFTNTGPTNINANEKKAIIRSSHIEQMARKIDSITQKAQRISLSMKKEATGELFHQLITNNNGERIDKKTSLEFSRLMGTSKRFSPGGATKKEQKDAIEIIKKNGKRIFNEQPEELIKLRNDIALVSLEELINKYEDMLSKPLQESYWQKLFKENPFILNMALGIPAIKVQDQASIGGISLSGSGNKIVDFLMKNSVSNNAAIIEIKTPSTKLVNSREYRSGTSAPSSELTGSTNQLLDQISSFQKEINSLKIASREYNLESYSVIGVLIVGTFPLDINEQKSLELFRGNSKNIQIVTFDELLQKLKNLYSFLNPNKTTIETSVTKEPTYADKDDVPF